MTAFPGVSTSSPLTCVWAFGFVGCILFFFQCQNPVWNFLTLLRNVSLGLCRSYCNCCLKVTWRRGYVHNTRFWTCNFSRCCDGSIVLCSSISQNRIVYNGCVKVAWCRGCMRNTSLLQLDIANRIEVAASRLQLWWVMSANFVLCVPVVPHKAVAEVSE